MKSVLKHFRILVLGFRPEETSYDRRGFRGATDGMRARLEQIGASFGYGYHTALKHDSPREVAQELTSINVELRGFAFEGAAMGLAMLDRLSPWRTNRFAQFLSGDGEVHTYMLHVGVGWVWARLPFAFRRTQQRLDPLLGWLAFDGWGFHEGFFHWRKHLADGTVPSRLRGYERRVFDQGLGRSLWFVNGGNPELITRTIRELQPERRADLWSGIGLGATYAGMVDESTLQVLRENAGSNWPQLAQGSAFAAKARMRAGNSTDYTDLATGVFCEMSALEAACLCDATLENLPAATPEPAYEIWRKRIQLHFQESKQSHHQETK